MAKKTKVRLEFEKQAQNPIKVFEEEMQNFITDFASSLETRLKNGINSLGKDIKGNPFESGPYVSSPILKKTGAMVNSISVKSEKFTVSSEIPQVFGKSGRNYAEIHNEGEGNQKTREFYGVPEEFDENGKKRQALFQKALQNIERRLK